MARTPSASSSRRSTRDFNAAQTRRAALSLTHSRIARGVPGKPSVRDIESALRLLQSRGALVANSATATTVNVRLLATPERIKTELGAGDELELSFLRALWRLVGVRINDGAIVDASGFPPGYGGTRGVMSLLAALQSRQFLVWTANGAGEVRLARPNHPLEYFQIDWPAIGKRRAGDVAKLDAMQKYAYLNSCRRQFVLSYFGDAAARPKCKGCDNCLGVKLAKRVVGRVAKKRRRRA